MPRFVIERSIPPVSRDELAEADGEIYCEYGAPTAALLWEHARRAGRPIDRVSEIGLEGEPGDVRLINSVEGATMQEYRAATFVVRYDPDICTHAASLGGSGRRPSRGSTVSPAHAR